MTINADLIAEVAISSVVAISIAYLAATLWLQVIIVDIRARHPSQASLLPEPALGGSRYFGVFLGWWVWTPAYAALQSKSLSRTVLASRILCVATLAAWIALFVAPPDFAERLDASIHHRPYPQ